MLRRSHQNASTFQSKRRSVFLKGRDVFQIRRGELFFCRGVSKFRREVFRLFLSKIKGVKFLVILVRHQSTFSLSTDYYDTWGCFSLSLLVMHPYDKRWQAFSASRVIRSRWLSTHSICADKYDKEFHTFRKNAMDEISWIYFAKTLDNRYSRFVYLRT